MLLILLRIIIAIRIIQHPAQPAFVSEIPSNGLAKPRLAFMARLPSQLFLRQAEVDRIAVVMTGPVGDEADQRARRAFRAPELVIHKSRNAFDEEIGRASCRER